MIGQHQSHRAELFHRAPRLGDGELDVVQRHLRRRHHASGAGIAEIAQPIVKRAADRRGEFRIDVVGAGGVRRIGSEHHAEIQSLGIHRCQHIDR